MTDEEWQELRRKAREAAEGEYESAASDIIRMTSEEVSEVVAAAGVDREKLTDLLQVVSDATKSNNEKADAIRSVSGFAEVAVSLLGKLL